MQPFTHLRLWGRVAAALTFLLLLWGTVAGSAAGSRPETAAEVTSPPPQVAAQNTRSLRPQVRQAERHDVSPPLREMAPLPPGANTQVQPWFTLPKTEGVAPAGRYGPTTQMEAAAGLNQSAVPAPLLTFEGVNNINGVLPPDTIGDVGPNHYVQMVNLSFAIYDKQGTLLFGPANNNTLWSDFGGICQTFNDGDPIVLYDQLADRWLMSQFALDFPDNFHECIAISQTPDPTGPWYRYDFLISTTKMNDYPHFGVWPDAYYMAVNQFDGFNFGWQGQGVVAFEREQMLRGLPARMVYFDLFEVSDLLGGMLPADWDGITPPPDGAPNPFVQINDDAWDASYPGDQLEVWEFHVDWENVAASRFTGPTHLPTQTPFSTSVNRAPQPGTNVRLDTIADRLMNRLQYRNFGAHQSMVVNHTVNVAGSAGIRWYELRDTGSGWQIYQEGTYAPDSNYRWMGSMAMDGSGNIALGYSVSSSSLYPSIRYTTRTTTDPLGTLSAGEQEIIAGSGSQTHSAGRWGDYSQMAVDPVDECTFWFTTEYLQTTGSAPWRTHVGSFRLPECTGANAGALTGVISQVDTGAPVGNGAPVRNARIRAGNFSATSAADGSYLLQLPAGDYPVSVSAYGYETLHFPQVVIQEKMTTTLNVALTSIPLVRVAGQVTDGSGAGWPLYAQIAIEGYPHSPIFTDPISGRYQVDLLAGTPATFTVRSALAGYLPQERTIFPGQNHPAEDFRLLVDATLCVAPGYHTSNSGGVFEDFSGLTDDAPPPGWTVIDNVGNGQVWRFDDPGDRGNLTGGRGGFATVDSDAYGIGNLQNSELRTPVMDFTDQPEVRLAFNTLYRTYLGDDKANVDVSVDGGATWTTVHTHARDTPGGVRVDLDISALAANQPAVQVRFHYFDAIFQWYWQVDDVLVGLQSCLATGEGLAVGHVYDANTGLGVNGATVSDGAGHTTIATDTPLDFGLDKGFYLMALPAGSSALTATANRYGPDSRPITITPLTITPHNFHLPAGRLAVTESVAITLPVNGAIQSLPVMLANLGGMDATFNLVAVEGAQSPPAPILAYASIKRKFPSKLLNDATSALVYTRQPPAVPLLPGGESLDKVRTGLAGAWGVAYDLDTNSLWLNEQTTRTAHAFQPDGSALALSADLTSWVTRFAADMAYDPVTRQVWAWNVGGDNCLHGFAAATGQAAGERICPEFPVSQRGVAYNPLRDTFFSGSWNNEIVYEFDRQGQVVSAANLGLAIAGLAYNPATDHLFVLANANVGFDVYVAQVGSAGASGYTLVGGFDLDGLGGWEQAGLALGCDGSLWAVNQATSTLLRADSGERGVCAWTASEWLTVKPTEGTVAAGGQQELTFTFNPQPLRPGPAFGMVRLGTDTPYGVQTIPVTLNIAHVYGVALAESSQNRAGQPGQVVSYILTVQNSGTDTDTFNLSLSGQSWSTTAPVAVGPVPLRGNLTAMVQVTIPPGASLGDRDTVSVLLTSQADPTAQTQGSLTTTAGSFQVALAPATSRRWGDPGTAVTHTVTITNQGTVADSFVLSRSGPPWPITMPATVGPLAPGTATPVLVVVQIPAGVAADTTNHTTLTATSMADNSRSAEMVLQTIASPVYRVSAVAQGSSSQSARPGQSVEYSLLITNQSNQSATFGLELSGHTWISQAPTQVGPLTAATGSATVKVQVTVAADALAGAMDRLSVAVTSLADASASTTVVLTTTASAVHSASWGRVVDPILVLPGQAVTVSLTAANTGNARDAYTVTLEGGEWPVQFNAHVAALDPGESRTVDLLIQAPQSALPKEIHSWTVSLFSQATGQLVAITTVTVQVDGYSLFLPHAVR